MKLHELGGHRPTEQAVRVLESQAGLQVDFSTIGPRRARGMLSRIQKTLREHRSTPNFHRSEQDLKYLQLLMLEQALQSHVKEQMATAGINPVAGAVMKDPKSKAVMDKVSRGQTLTPDEQQTVNKIALMQKESKKSMVREQNELQQAQVVLAAQDMIDRMQKMLEEVSEMQFKDLPALADSIKNDMGAEQASGFQSASAAALTQLLSAIQTAKTEMESAQGVLTGAAPMVPGTEPMAGDELPTEPAGDDLEAELDIDANLGNDEEEIPGEILGRERR